jgi:hypothetical protein
MSWTSVPKPTGSNYTYVNFEGKQTYDDPTLIYDDPSVFYDSYNPSAWTEVAKPTNSSFTIRAGMATGLVMPITYATNYTFNSSSWTQVPKPS